jgi:hypothetical protein
MTRKLQYVPIGPGGYRLPVSEWPKRDLMALDTARLDDEQKDPEATNRGGYAQQRTGPAQNKPREFQVGALANSYASEPAEDDDLDDLPDEVVETLLAHAEESGFGEEMVRRLRARLGGRQAEDDDRPPSFKGQPLRGGAMDRGLMAMDKRVGSFASRNPDAARISGISTLKRDGIAMDAKLRASKATGFAARWPDAMKIRFSY